MFDQDFYPTPPEVIEYILSQTDVSGRTVLEPSAGNGAIVDALFQAGANQVIACEKHPELRKIVESKCMIISDDFLAVQSQHISHIDQIIMNPPFSADEKHILHAYNVAPEGCKIIALCNANTLKNDRYLSRKELKQLIKSYGYWEELGSCFRYADRKTDVPIALVVIQKPSGNYEHEFAGFFMEEEVEQQSIGIMPYNLIRDLVNRYVESIKIFDLQLEQAKRMNELVNGYFSCKIGLSITNDQAPITRNEFKKEMQKSAWKWIFDKMNMHKYTTKGLRDDINKFIEKQTDIPFTMRNIYRMIEMIIGTTEQRMDRAIEDVFDKLTRHYHENRYAVEGWKTNSHYLFNRKFILPYMTSPSYSRGFGLSYNGNSELIDDLVKAICFLSGKNYDDFGSFWSFINASVYEYGTWYEYAFFRFKGFKKGTMHFEFLDADVWGKLNQRIAKIKGYPLFENNKS